MSINLKRQSFGLQLIFFGMKKILFAVLLGFPIFIFGQDFSEEDQNEIDRYNAIIMNPNSPDTAIANSYLELSSLLYVSNIDTMIPLCNKVIEIVSPRLAEGTEEMERIELLNLHSGALNNIAVVYMTYGEIDKCLDYLEQSLVIVQKTEDKYQIATALNNIGFVLNDQGNITKALDYYSQSLDISKEINDKTGIATLLNNIASIYKEQNNLTSALDYYQRSLPLLQSENKLRSISGVYNSIGSIVEKQGNKKLARQYYLKSLDISKKIKDKRGLSNCYSSLAGLYSINNIDSSLIYHNKSLALRRALNFKDGIAISTINIAEIEFKRNNLAKAKPYALESLQISQEVGYPRNIQKAAKLLSKIYEQEKKYGEALKMIKLHIQMKDSLDLVQNQKALVERKAEYEYETKKKQDDLEHDIEIAVKDEKIKSKQSITNLLIILLCAIALFVVILIERLIKINRLKLNLLDKNTENEELVVNLESTVEERTLTLKESFNVIEEKEKNYSDLLDKSSEMIQMLDPEGRITYVNQAWLANMKFDRLEEVLGRPIVEFFNQKTLSLIHI